MQAVLTIPFAEKDAAKNLARASGGRLSWHPETTTWRYDGPALPPGLHRYQQDAPESRTHLLDVPFPLRATAQAAGARWDPTVGAYTWRGTALPEDLRPYRSQPYSLERLAEHRLNGTRPAPTAAAGQVTPRVHQHEAIDAVGRAVHAKRCGILVADDVGLGKTISAWCSVRCMRGIRRVLIVCPLAVVAHWRRTIRQLGDGGLEVVVINYDRLGKLFQLDADQKVGRTGTPLKKRTQNKRRAAHGTLEPFDVVVLDESHKCRNPQALRSKLAARLVAEARFTLWLSATAGQNPLELSYLAPLLAEVTGDTAANLADFERWCQAQGIGVRRGAYGKWEWDREGPTADRDLATMRRLLFEGRVPAGLRRRPEDIAGWPEVHRIPMPVALEAAAQLLYDREWGAFRQALRLAKGQGAAGKKNALVAQLRFRQKASLLRVPGTIAFAEELLENGQQVAISCQFRESLAAIQAGLEQAGHACAVIHGDLGAAEKERERVRFQQGRALVVLFTVEEGISLQAGEVAVRATRTPRSTILHDARYSAISLAQIEGRCHRDGQYAPNYYVFAEDTVEEQVVRTVVGRLKAMKTMIGDDTATLDAIEAVLAAAADDERRAA